MLELSIGLNVLCQIREKGRSPLLPNLTFDILSNYFLYSCFLFTPTSGRTRPAQWLIKIKKNNLPNDADLSPLKIAKRERFPWAKLCMSTRVQCLGSLFVSGWVFSSKNCFSIVLYIWDTFYGSVMLKLRLRQCQGSHVRQKCIFSWFIQFSQGRSPYTQGTFNKPDFISQTLALSLWYFLVENCFQLYYTPWDIFHRIVM